MFVKHIWVAQSIVEVNNAEKIKVIVKAIVDIGFL